MFYGGIAMLSLRVASSARNGCGLSEPVLFEERGPQRLVYRIGVVEYVVDPAKGSYTIAEPGLDNELRDLLESVIVKYSSTNRGEGKIDCEELLDIIYSLASKLGIEGKVKRDEDTLLYYVSKYITPWEFLYPFILDPLVEEISVLSSHPVMVIHRSVGFTEYLESNVVAPSEYAMRTFLQKLASAAGTAVSPAFPIGEAELDGHRVTMIYGTIASSSTVSVRKQPQEPLSLEELIAQRMLSKEAANYLLEVLRSKGMIFIIGPQGTGKTTLLNALLEELPRDWKIVVVEDVPELRPRHPHFLSLRVRRLRSLAESQRIEIGYRDLLRVALRLRGHFTGITEARGEEVLELFEAAALGEASAATFHARDWTELKLRLFKLGIREHMLPLLWSIVVLDKVRLYNGMAVRRVVKIYEVGLDGSEILIFKYDPNIDMLKRVRKPTRIDTSIG